MTVKELCDVFSKEIGSTFELSKDEILEQLFDGTTIEMTEHEVYAKVILNSMLISANLAVQPMLLGLVEMGVIPKDVLARTKLKPDIRLVKTAQQSAPMENEGKKRIKVTELTVERRKKTEEKLEQK